MIRPHIIQNIVQNNYPGKLTFKCDLDLIYQELASILIAKDGNAKHM